MMASLFKSLPLAILLLAASGCELLNFEAPSDPYSGDGTLPDGAQPPGAVPLYPFRPGSIWQYTVTALDGSKSVKYVSIGKDLVKVSGNGEHQLDMAYPVNTSSTVGGQPWLTTMQQQVGNKIVNWREMQFDQWHQLLVDTLWEPEQLEIDQSDERTRPGASWLENYTEVTLRSGAIQTLTQNSSWKVVGQELLALPGIDTPFQTVVFQKSPFVGGTDDAGTGDAGKGDGGPRPSGDAGKTSDAGVGRPLLTSETWSEAVDSGADANSIMPKTLWYARGYGKVKEAGGGEPMEELSGLELH